MSKGSNPRPIEVDPQTYADNWERTFGSDGARVGAEPVSKTGDVGAIPTAPANHADGCICYWDGECCCGIKLRD